MEQHISSEASEGDEDITISEAPVTQYILMNPDDTLTGVEKHHHGEAIPVQFNIPEGTQIVDIEFDKTTVLQEDGLEYKNTTSELPQAEIQEEDPGMEEDNFLAVFHPHPSIVTGLGDMHLKLCDDPHCACGGTGSSVHCPMCPGSETLGDQASAEQHILQKHWSKRTEVCKDICLLTCFCMDTSVPHIHCPLCGAMLPRDQDEDHHLIACINKQKELPRGQDSVTPVEANSVEDQAPEKADPEPKKTEMDENLPPQNRYQKFYHHTMVSSLLDLNLEPCTVCCGGRKIHCPICPVTLYRPNKRAAVEHHVEHHHWRHGVKFKGTVIMKCTAPCKGKVNGMPLDYHWHCPLCPVKVSSKQAMNGHLCAHKKGTQLRHRTNAEWAALLGPEAASVLFKSKSFPPMLEKDADYGEVELQTGRDIYGDKSDYSAESKTYTPKKKEVFQTVVGLLSKDMVQAIPGSLSVFFSQVQEETPSIQYTASDDWCLLQGDWKSFSSVHRKLKHVLTRDVNEEEGEVVGPAGDARMEGYENEDVKNKPRCIGQEDSESTCAQDGSGEQGNLVDDISVDNSSAPHDIKREGLESSGVRELNDREAMTEMSIDGCNQDLNTGEHPREENLGETVEREKMGLRSGKAIKGLKKVVEDKQTSEIPETSTEQEHLNNDFDESIKTNVQVPQTFSDAQGSEKKQEMSYVQTEIRPHTKRGRGRGRGRPRKSQTPIVITDDSVAIDDPRVEEKDRSETATVEPSRDAKEEKTTTRGRGRPRKFYTKTEAPPPPILTGKRKRKPTRKLYENGDVYNDDNHEEENHLAEEPDSKKANVGKKSVGSELKNEEDDSKSENMNSSRVKLKSDMPDITISIHEDSGTLLSVSVSSADKDNVKTEPANDNSANGIPPNDNKKVVNKGLSLARKVKVSVCTACKKVFRDKHRFHQHIFGSNCIKKKRMRDKNFKLPPDIAVLFKEVNEEVTGAMCPKCGKSFTQRFHAQMHYASKSCVKTAEEKYNGLVMNPETRAYHCRHCEFSSHIVHRVILHEQRKHMEKTEPCPLCNKLYSSQTLVREHIKAVHAMGNERTVCELCGVSVATKCLSQHMKIKHDPTYVRPSPTTKKLYSCPHCKTFKSTSYARYFRHKIKAHKEADKQCPQCDQKFAMMGEVNRHIKFVHQGLQQETSECPQCGKAVTKKNLAAHIRMVHEKVRKHACEICGRAFLTKFTLKQHIETHKPTDQRDTRFLCAFCGKGFFNKTHYTDHLNTHTGARPYECLVCHKTFRCCPALAKHKEIHRNINLHCATCNLHFPSRKALRIHNNKEHSTSMYKCVCNAEYNSQETLLAHRRGCGQWQQANPMENHALLQEQQMAMIIQPDEDGTNATPGTYIVMEGKEGEQTVMVLQSLTDLQDGDVVEALAGSQVMNTITLTDENQVVESVTVDDDGVAGANEISEEDEEPHKVMALSDSGIVTLSSSADVMAMASDQTEDATADQLTVVAEPDPNDGTTLLEIPQDINPWTLVQGNVEGSTTVEPSDVDVAAMATHPNASAPVAQTEDLNRYLCGHCQRLFMSLDDVQAHMIAEHMASETGEVELALHQPASENDTIYTEPEEGLL